MQLSFRTAGLNGGRLLKMPRGTTTITRDNFRTKLSDSEKLTVCFRQVNMWSLLGTFIHPFKGMIAGNQDFQRRKKCRSYPPGVMGSLNCSLHFDLSQLQQWSMLLAHAFGKGSIPFNSVLFSIKLRLGKNVPQELRPMALHSKRIIGPVAFAKVHPVFTEGGFWMS